MPVSCPCALGQQAPFSIFRMTRIHTAIRRGQTLLRKTTIRNCQWNRSLLFFIQYYITQAFYYILSTFLKRRSNFPFSWRRGTAGKRLRSARHLSFLIADLRPIQRVFVPPAAPGPWPDRRRRWKKAQHAPYRSLKRSGMENRGCPSPGPVRGLAIVYC